MSRDPEPAGWVGFGLFGSVPEPFTTYQEIRAVPAGSIVWVDRVGRATRQSNTSRSQSAYLPGRRKQRRQQTTMRSQALAREALLRQRSPPSRGRCAVGAFLSSGIDSGALGRFDARCGTAGYSDSHARV